MKKQLCLLLALLCLANAASLTSCSDAATQETETPVSDGTDLSDPGAVETVEETEARILPNLPEVTYDGAAFRFYSWDHQNWRVWDDIWVAELNGEPINDAVFNRNQIIEEKYDVTIQFTYDEYTAYEENLGNYTDPNVLMDQYSADALRFVMLSSPVLAGEDSWEVVLSMGHCIPRLYASNVFYNLHDLEYIDFDQPWWDQNCVESFTLAGYMPFTVSDMIILDKAVASATFYNKQIAENHQLGSLYDLVYEGTWTIAKMIELGEIVSNDVDGDGVRTDNDLYGLVSGDDPVYMLFHSAGGRYITKDDQGYPQLSFESEHNFTAIKYYLEELMYNENLTCNNAFKDDRLDATKMFIQDHGLFMMSALKATDSLREMEADFGILPVPKYQEEQENYSSSVSVFGGNLISVPLTCQSLEMTGVLLEAMSAESMYTLIPAFYDSVLKEKSARDQASIDMLDIIINNMVFDVGDFYNLADFPDYFLRITGSAAHLGRDQRTSDIASFWASKKGNVTGKLKQLVKILDTWNAMTEAP